MHDRYDGSETCFSPWQYGPLFTLIALALLPVMMTLRAMWLKRRFWASSSGSSSRGWFWEAAYYEFYRSSFRDAFPHWLPVTLYVSLSHFSSPLLILSCSGLRVLVLMMTIIQFPYWRLFCINIVLFIFLIAELIIKPWRLRSVQLFSTVSQFLLLFATGILFRPAGEEWVFVFVLILFCP
jgi:hypothetical protein